MKKIDVSGRTHAAGGVARASDRAIYDDLLIGHNTERDRGGSVKADDDSDTDDDIIVEKDFGGGDSFTVSHHHAVNLIDP